MTEYFDNKIRVFAPATVANVACGFDSLGFAINQPGDIVEAVLQDEPGVRISEITGENGRLPTEPEKNTAGVAVLALLEHLEETRGIEMSLHKRMPLGSGLGSSAASSVAALFAANELLGRPLKKGEMLPFAMKAEASACGSPHADNVAPGLLGGFALIRSYDPLDVVSIEYPENLCCTVLHPHIELRTEDSRRILRKHIKLQDAVIQWSNLAGLIAGLAKSDFDLISRSLNDIIFEPVRSLLIPGFDNVKGAAIEAGALGCSISGSGPSVFALSTTMDKAYEVGAAMKEAFSELQLDSDIYVSAVNKKGPRVLQPEEDPVQPDL
ncbi:homoserine kinase [Natronogracilivirga saccharolytica]|uniref:Homoserine kinase n=1 Tax=Natronogracilivirga saccharolytica TaxID=2812953 RepID=A0A8J7UXB6_9BACT|nr:homoserine kinase [Natronogracilivirga saccharolytica]MBP3193134.1 homoserine kinase [Natronogracilivirga saccharolytica]